jgi:hypothetical protein
MAAARAPQESLDSPIDRRSDYYRQTARQAPPARPPRQPLVTIPNVLTFIRLFLVPVLGLVWFSERELAPICCTAVFTAASATDWLDGFLARKVSGGRPPPPRTGAGRTAAAGCRAGGAPGNPLTARAARPAALQLKIATVFGAFLDPVADKLMWVAAAREVSRTHATHQPRRRPLPAAAPCPPPPPAGPAAPACSAASCAAQRAPLTPRPPAPRAAGCARRSSCSPSTRRRRCPSSRWRGR